MGQVTELDLTLDALGFIKKNVDRCISDNAWYHPHIIIYGFNYGYTLCISGEQPRGMGSKEELLKAIINELK